MDDSFQYSIWSIREEWTFIIDEEIIDSQSLYLQRTNGLFSVCSRSHTNIDSDVAAHDLTAGRFSNSLVAVVIFAMLVTSLTTGFITRRITTLVNAVECMIYGMRIFSPLILMYVFSNQLYYSFCYTFIP